MNLRTLLTPFLIVTATTFAADAPKLPSIPADPIAKKKERLFSDDFERAELGKDKGWAIVVPTYSLEKGTLKGTQMRFDTPAKDGKPAVKGHQAVIGNDIPTKDSVIEFRFKLGGAQSVTAEFDDRKFNGSHYGHLCMARIAANKITLVDQKGLAVARPEGSTGEPSTPAGRKNIAFPLSLDPQTWHTFMLETVGDTMRQKCSENHRIQPTSTQRIQLTQAKAAFWPRDTTAPQTFVHAGLPSPLGPGFAFFG